VQDENQRFESVGQIYQIWRAKDGTAANAALAGSGLPPDKVKQIQEMQQPQQSTR